MLTAGDTLSLAVEKPAAGGAMIARHEGRIVLVTGAIPGERVRARIVRVAKGLAHATTVDVVERSADRRDPPGDPLCGGCLYAHIAYARQLEIKSLVIADAFARIARLPLPAPVAVAPSPEAGYRMRARIHMRGGQLGFFREGTHDICDAAQTRQLLPETLDVLTRLGAALRSLGPDASYEIEVSENLDASHRAVHLDGGAPIGARTLNLLAGTDGLTGLASSTGSRGDVYVTDVIAFDGHAPVSLRRHVLAFFQGNRFLLHDLVAHVVSHVAPGSDVVDLYAGAGLFALTAAIVRDARVTAVEGDGVSADDLRANCTAAAPAATPLHQAVETFVARDRAGSHAPDSVIVDPPRTGMSREALEGTLRLRAKQLVYVSCDVATLARDARRVVDAGYAIEQVRAFDLFPNTPHVETVVVFRQQM
ncbi:MAG TPA: TRAM domain-containing protein [Vicinamibacterales bacterium]|jgi:23S rRNA (uracil1939-C5)-methyltransferase|nr:TRAM domain-containing protein [Vicinamibacterales bacterium]